MAYEAGVRSKVSPELLTLYEAGIVLLNSSWYVEHIGLGRRVQFEMEDKAITALFPRLDELLKQLDTEPYCTAAIASEASWLKFVDDLKQYSEDVAIDLIPSPQILRELPANL
jgi:acyl-CoA oxidase